MARFLSRPAGMESLPILLFGAELRRQVIDFAAPVEAGTIGPRDPELFDLVETAADAIERIEGWPRRGNPGGPAPSPRAVGV